MKIEYQKRRQEQAAVERAHIARVEFLRRPGASEADYRASNVRLWRELDINMTAECIPISTLPGTSALYRDFAEPGASRNEALLHSWYPADPFTLDWAVAAPTKDAAHREALAAELRAQAASFGAGEAALANISRLEQGAAAVVTGQQVGLFGGPLLTLLKAATAIRKAKDATAASGREHVPIFWLASEDHDLAEVDQVALLTKTEVETLRLGLLAGQPVPVGGLVLPETAALLDHASDLLGWAPICDVLREAYVPGTTLATAFGRLLTKIFAAHGLVVMDAATRGFHALGASTLRAAMEDVDALEAALLERTTALEAAGYHAQVLVKAGQSLLFLLDETTGARLPLRHSAEGAWKAGAQSYTTAELLTILEAAPERLSPNALLRPIFQDTILPTAAYIGGPAEIAYFAQSAVVYEHILGRITPVLPRLSATLVEPAIAQLLAQHELDLPRLLEDKTVKTLALRLGARAMPIEGKRKLAAVGNAMDTELTALTDYMAAMSAELGRAAGVSANKMRYQMNRLRRMAARFETERQASLTKHATAIMLHLLPEGHLQERVLGGVWFLAHYGETLPTLLVEHAAQECPGHRVIWL
jgi:bacillithiol biosynthesis cysteine-adding enzyme BshC